MERIYDSSLSPGELLEKSLEYLRGGIQAFERADKADEDFNVRRGASEACEDVFHALVVLSDAVLHQAAHAPVEDHDDRIEALESIGRTELAHLYERVKDALHTAGYYGQRVGPRQRLRIREVQEAIEREIEKLA